MARLVKPASEKGQKMTKTSFVHSRLLIAALVLFVPLLSCNNDTTTAPSVVSSDPPIPYRYADWMKNIPDSRSIADFTIPGTHDTGADRYTSQQGPFGETFVICQDYRLSSQLELGVRWFDIRLRLENGGLAVHHGPYYLHKNFDDMLEPAIKFLEDNPSETVIFMIKQEDSKESDLDFSKAVYERLKAHELSRFYLKQDNLPTLGEVRGKIIIVRRFHNIGLGHDLGFYMPWDDNVKGKMYQSHNYSYYVQDHYSLNTVSSDTKIDEIKDTINKAHDGKYDGTLYLNFTSGERVASDESLMHTAASINPEVDAYVKDKSQWQNNKMGVIFLNFAGSADTDNGLREFRLMPNLVKHIIEVNDI